MSKTVGPPALPGERILWISFNQKKSRFVLGTTQGFRVYYTIPLEEAFTRSVGIVEILDSTNIVALTGGGDDPYIQQDSVGIWNDYQKRMIEVIQFKDKVCNIKMGRTGEVARLVVATETSVTGFNLLTLTKTFRIPTIPNVRGLCPFTVSNSCVTSFPAECTGKLGFHVEDTDTMMAEILPPFDVHESALVAVELSQDGKLVATAAEKTGNVRVFNIDNEEKVLEFRRDNDVSAVALSEDGRYLAVASTKGECQVYSMYDREALPSNPKLSGFKSKFFSPSYRVATIPIPKTKTVVMGFSVGNILVIVTGESIVLEAKIVELGQNISYEIKQEVVKLLDNDELK